MKNNTFSQEQMEVMKNLFKLSERDLHTVMSFYLKNLYGEDNVIVTPHYIYAVGAIPIALAGHLDTVFDEIPTEIYYDQEQKVMWSPQGLGADDRAGIYAIFDITSRGARPYVFLLTGEEVGGVGAQALAKRDPPPLKFIIELDRHGADDCVFYDCGNEKFHSLIESFGFKIQRGIYSDISFICPAWDIAGVNLSIGYYNEHDFCEYLNLKQMAQTIEKVDKIISEIDNCEYYKNETRKYPALEKKFCNFCNRPIDSKIITIYCVGEDGREDSFQLSSCNDCIKSYLIEEDGKYYFKD